jgi:hypothetical protein
VARRRCVATYDARVSLRALSFSTLAALALTAAVAGCGGSGSGDSGSGSKPGDATAAFIAKADALCQIDVEARPRINKKIVAMQKSTKPSANVEAFSENIKQVARYNEQLVSGKAATLAAIKKLPQPDIAELQQYYAERDKAAAAWDAQTQAQVAVTNARGAAAQAKASKAVAEQAKALTAAIGKSTQLAKSVGFNTCSVQ